MNTVSFSDEYDQVQTFVEDLASTDDYNREVREVPSEVVDALSAIKNWFGTTLEGL